MRKTPPGIPFVAAPVPLLFLTGDLRVPNVLTVLKLFDELLVKLDREHDLYPFPLLVDDKAGPERSGLFRGRGRYGPPCVNVSLMPVIVTFLYSRTLLRGACASP
jgi:hypothetical protein